MRHFIYQSRSKISMLGEQLGLGGESGLELNANLSAGPLSAGAKKRSPTLTTSQQLDRIVRKLESEGLIGSIERPQQYFRGDLRMHWGSFGGHWGVGDMVYFSGLEDQTLVGLGGASRHVIGAHPEAMPEGSSVFSPMSYTPFIMHELAKENDVNVEHAGLYPYDSESERLLNISTAMVSAHEKAKAPAEAVEFVAKTLVHHPWDSDWNYLAGSWVDGVEDVLLGTPVYVALAE